MSLSFKLSNNFWSIFLVFAGVSKQPYRLIFHEDHYLEGYFLSLFYRGDDRGRDKFLQLKLGLFSNDYILYNGYSLFDVVEGREVFLGVDEII